MPTVRRPDPVRGRRSPLRPFSANERTAIADTVNELATGYIFSRLVGVDHANDTRGKVGRPQAAVRNEAREAQRKIGRDSPAKRKPRRSGASRATWKPSPRNGACGHLDLRRSRERVCIKLTTSAKSTSTKSQLPRRPARFSKKPRLFGGQFNGVFWFQVKAGIDLLIG